MYFVALCTPTSSDITACPVEVSKCEWKPFNEIYPTVRNEAFSIIKNVIDLNLPILPQLELNLRKQEAYELKLPGYQNMHYAYA